MLPLNQLPRIISLVKWDKVVNIAKARGIQFVQLIDIVMFMIINKDTTYLLIVSH